LEIKRAKSAVVETEEKWRPVSGLNYKPITIVIIATIFRMTKNVFEFN
jgi:hypothetical protein